MANIGILVNPASGRNAKDPRLAGRLAEMVASRGHVESASSLDELSRAALSFRRRGVDVLAICGGDGTNGVALTGFVAAYGDEPLPLFALLRGGTMNTTANALGVPRKGPEALLSQLLGGAARWAPGRVPSRRQQLLSIRAEATPPGGPTAASLPPPSERLGFLFGTGAIAGYLAEYYREGEEAAARRGEKRRRLGPVTAAKTLLKGVGSTLTRGPMVARLARPFIGSVLLDDGTEWPERDYLAIAAGTIDQIGLGFRPFYRARSKPGSLHALGIHTSASGFIRRLPAVWRAAPMGPKHTYEALVPSLRVRPSEGRTQYMVDGDLQEAEGDVTVSVGPEVHLVAQNHLKP